MKKSNFKLLKNLSPELKKKFLHLIKEKEKVKKVKNNEENLKMIYDQMFDCMIYLLSKTNEPQMIASTMMALVPVFIILPAVVLFKQKVTLPEILGAILSVGGVALFFL